MSLTSLLKDRDSWVWDWIREVADIDAITRFVGRYNKLMPRPIAAPNDIDPLFSGMAFTYLFRLWLSPGCLVDTVAYRQSDREQRQLIEWMIQEVERQVMPDRESMLLPVTSDSCMLYAKVACIMALLDKDARSSGAYNLEERLIIPKVEALPSVASAIEGTISALRMGTQIVLPSVKPARAMIDDVDYHDLINPACIVDMAQLFQTIADSWDRQSLSLRGKKLYSNPTFDLSWVCNGADAQLIIDGILIDIKTSRKHRPFTVETFLQQIIYFMLDTSDSKGIRSIAWHFSRHQCVLHCPIKDIVKRPYEKREDFNDRVSEILDQDRLAGLLNMGGSGEGDPDVDAFWRGDIDIGDGYGYGTDWY